MGADLNEIAISITLTQFQYYNQSNR